MKINIMWEDQPVVCGVLMRQANILEQVATPPLSPRQPSSQHTSAQMETMEGLRARALSHTTELAGSRSRSPTPESSLRPIAPDQEAISTVDLARILQSLHGSHVLLVATPLFSSPIACTSVFFGPTRFRVGVDVVACGISFWQCCAISNQS